MARSSSAALVFLLLGAASLPAQELLTPGEQVLRELRAALAAGQAEPCIALLGEIGELARYPASAAEAAALLRAAADATRDKNQTVVVAALRALGATGVPAAGAHIEPFLRAAKPPAGQEAAMAAAVRAAGRLRLAAHVPALLKLAHKCPDLTVAEQALHALGGFCAAAAGSRKHVTGKVLEVCQSLSRRRARWRRLRAPGLRALQRLTGRKLNRVDQFAAWWSYAKTLRDPFAPAGD
jgi:hypothetical protein